MMIQWLGMEGGEDVQVGTVVISPRSPVFLVSVRCRVRKKHDITAL